MANELFIKEKTIYRVLKPGLDKLLVVKSDEKKLPFFISPDELEKSCLINQDDLLKATGISFHSYDELDEEEKGLIHKIFSSIGFILSYLDDFDKRKQLIKLATNEYGVSSSTIRNRLYKYLLFQDIRIFLPKGNKKERELTSDELNFQWALNKYYYNPLKLSLIESYRRMIKEKYYKNNGELAANYPSFRRFSYFFRRTFSKEKLVISREGKGSFMRNTRTLLGDGVRGFCSTIGYGMIDSTICDLFLVDEEGNLVGRPIMTACVDGYSSMCMGYWIGYEGGMKSLNGLVKNICTNKIEHCKRFNIDIKKEDWNVSSLPYKFITDKGKEYTSQSFSQLVELGLEIVNLPPYRPELKGPVEKFFDLIQSSFKDELASKGVIFEDYQERGGVDYRKKASLTIDEFERIVLLCIIRYNTGRIIDLPYEKVGKIEPFANSLWNDSLESNKDYLIEVDPKILTLTTLPRTIGKFKREGLIVNKLRYRNYDFIERFLSGGEAEVSYDPNDVSKVWVHENGEYFEFDLIDSYFMGKDLGMVESILKTKSDMESAAEEKSLKSRIELAQDIEIYAGSLPARKVSIIKVRKHRKESKDKRK